MSTVALAMSDLEPTQTERITLGSAVLSFMVCVAAPIAFWLVVMAWVANAVFAIALSSAALLIVAAAMALVLVPIWAGIILSKRT